VLNLPENGRDFFTLKMSTTNLKKTQRIVENSGKFVVCKKIRCTQFGGEKLLNF